MKKNIEIKPFRASIVYGIIIFINVFIIALEMGLILSSWKDAIPRLIFEIIGISIAAIIFFYSITQLYDTSRMHSTWEMVLSVDYEGYVLRYMGAHLLGHTILLVFILFIVINGQTVLMLSQYDFLAIPIAFAIAMMGTMIKEKELPKRHPAEQPATDIESGKTKVIPIKSNFNFIVPIQY